MRFSQYAGCPVNAGPLKARPLAAANALVLALAFTGDAQAQDKPRNYPTKPIRVITGIAPGGGLDNMARLAAQKISERWGQSVIVDNRPGGGTVIAMDIVANANPDGYTLLAASETLMMNEIGRAHV